jgi:transcriptional regulator with XRE-family HTH domain
MPRPVRVKSRIRDLRAIIGKTQREFALSIGISPIALNRIENGSLALSRRVVFKILVETGVDPRCLYGKLRTLRTPAGEPYTLEFYNKRKDVFFFQDEQLKQEEATMLATEWIGGWADILLRASVLGYRKQMWQVWVEIVEMLERCRTDFNLARPIAAILAKEHPGTEWNTLKPPPRYGESKKATAKQKPRSSSRRRRKA